MPTATVRRSGFRLPGFCRPDFPRPGRLFIASIASGLLCAAVLTPGLARADTAYIIDEIVVPLRETPCSSCRVIRQGMRSGAAVKVLETADGWTRAEVAEGIAGWLPSRYLTPEPIAREQLSALREEVQRLQAENLRLAKTTRRQPPTAQRWRHRWRPGVTRWRPVMPPTPAICTRKIRRS
ncbi:MAG: TIGR04211 family SH3 domain-containing protein [Gammaproteobacteria bacterium]|nr:TIGR04211 family SH3 domain-containing protein [Gammaproteobacteria bacterium]